MSVGDEQHPADLDACEREPLAFSGRIQDVGALFVVDPRNLRLTHVSGNLERWFVRPDTLGTPPQLQEFFHDDCAYFVHRRRPLFDERHFLIRGAVSNRGIEGDILLAAHSDAQHLYEFEMRPTGAETTGTPPKAQVSLSERSLPEEIDVEGALRRIHSLTTYPKIMLYHFLEDGAGEVVAELSDQQLDSYQGLRFPASDIPQVARRLYIDNPFRLIFDTRGTEVDVEQLSGSDAELDLSLSTLRSVSPVHVEYLGNMGVRSSASFPIMVMGKLWGLLAMHAVEPTALSMDTRMQVLRIVEHEFARRIMDQRVRDDHRRFNANAKLLDDCAIALMHLDDSPRSVELATQALRKLITCDGLLLRLDGHVLNADDYISAADADRLANLGAEEATGGQFSTHTLGRHLTQDETFRRRASGLLYSALDARRQRGRIEVLWLRAEQAETVTWAGRPVKERHTVDGEERISPRRSFSAWQQLSEGAATAWRSGDLMLASKLLVNILTRDRGEADGDDAGAEAR
ncbi:MAG: GAF domain-containing protein [Pseudomonadota bacterium]